MALESLNGQPNIKGMSIESPPIWEDDFNIIYKLCL